MAPEPMFWMTMHYECRDCKTRHNVFLEIGCEGPGEADRMRVPVPFTVGCICGGRFEHVDWEQDRLLFPFHQGVPEAPHFRYPSKSQFKKWKEHACGVPIGFRPPD